jgi:4-hydroxy-3-methylbut-2-enyl diphosphate reductase
MIIACPHGYCAGVARAIAASEEALSRCPAPIYCFNEIVHNNIVVKRLEECGMIFTRDITEIPEGSLVLFSAHGVSPAIREQAAERNLNVIDATCPFVTKVHSEVKRFAKEGKTILLIGHKGHEEIEGVAGEAPDQVVVIKDEDEARAVTVDDPDKVAVLTQTTLSVSDAEKIIDTLKSRFPHLVLPPTSDICYATQNRQAAVCAVADISDLVIVLGSQKSSNSKRLVEVAQGCDCETVLITSLDELTQLSVESVETLGLTAAASTPESFVRDVTEFLGTKGFTDIEMLETVKEDVSFPLPKVNE